MIEGTELPPSVSNEIVYWLIVHVAVIVVSLAGIGFGIFLSQWIVCPVFVHAGLVIFDVLEL